MISESLNYFDPKSNPELYKRGESEPLRLNELTVYSHGSPDGLVNLYYLNAGGEITDILKSDSIMFRNLVEGKSKSLTMVIKACNTSKLVPFKSYISHVLTKENSGLTIYSAAGYFFPNGQVGYHEGKNLFQWDIISIKTEVILKMFLKNKS